MNAHEVVASFCQAIGRKDPDACRSLLADQVVYHNIPLDPIVGRQATMAAIEGMFSSFGRLEFRMLAMATDGETVLTERLDIFEVAGHEVSLPVMGAFDVRGEGITSWRDYFDVGQAAKLMDPNAAGPQ